MRERVTLASVADFKRFLKLPGATVQVVRNDWSDPAKTIHPIQPKAGLWDAKTVDRVQSNCVRFSSGSYLNFPKASHARFADDTVTLCMDQDGSFKAQLVYTCWLATPAPEGV